MSGVSPSSGPIAGGTSVGISGTGFVSGMTVQFGSNLHECDSKLGSTERDGGLAAGFVHERRSRRCDGDHAGWNQRHQRRRPVQLSFAGDSDGLECAQRSSRGRDFGRHHRNGFHRSDIGQVRRQHGQLYRQLGYADHGNLAGGRRYGGCYCDDSQLQQQPHLGGSVLLFLGSGGRQLRDSADNGGGIELSLAECIDHAAVGQCHQQHHRASRAKRRAGVYGGHREWL